MVLKAWASGNMVYHFKPAIPQQILWMTGEKVIHACPLNGCSTHFNVTSLSHIHGRKDLVFCRGSLSTRPHACGASEAMIVGANSDIN
jgi:hypothetical protein